MKKIFSLLLLFCTLTLNAQTPFAVYPINTFNYDLLEAWLTLGGKTAPSDSYPLTSYQMESILKMVPASLTPDCLLQALTNEISTGATEYADELDAVFNLDLTLQLYLQSNPENENREWDYNDRTAPLSFDLQAYFIDHIQFFVDVDIKQDHMVDKAFDQNYSNIWRHFQDYDFEPPHQSFVVFGDKHWYLKLGRDRLQWGASRTGGLSLSDTADYFDHLMAALTWDGFCYSTTWIHLDPTINAQDLINYPLIGGELPVKNFFAHRMELRPLENLSISLIEEIVYGGKDPTLEILNPLSVFHSTFDWPHLNINFEAGLKWVPLPGLLIFGTFVADQINGFTETGTNTIPGAYGYQAGIHFYQAIASGYFMAGSEISQTDPWMYMEHDTLTNFSSRRHYSSGTTMQWVDIDQSIGFPFGPDARFWLNWIEYIQPGSWKAGISLSLLQKGDVDFSSKYEWTPENAAATTPSGPHPITRWSTEVYGEYTWSGLTVKGRIYFLNFENYDHEPGNSVFDIQAALSAGWTFTF